MDKIRNEIDVAEGLGLGGQNILLAEYKDKQGKLRPMYILPHATAMMLAKLKTQQ